MEQFGSFHKEIEQVAKEQKKVLTIAQEEEKNPKSKTKITIDNLLGK